MKQSKIKAEQLKILRDRTRQWLVDHEHYEHEPTFDEDFEALLQIVTDAYEGGLDGEADNCGEKTGGVVTDHRTRLLEGMTHMALAVSMLKIEQPEAKVQLALIAKKPDGSGRIGATFDSAQFFDDIARVMGFDDLKGLMTTEDPSESKNKS